MENSTTPATPQEARDALLALCRDTQTFTVALDIAERRGYDILALRLRDTINGLIEAQVEAMRELQRAPA